MRVFVSVVDRVKMWTRRRRNASGRENASDDGASWKTANDARESASVNGSAKESENAIGSGTVTATEEVIVIVIATATEIVNESVSGTEIVSAGSAARGATVAATEQGQGPSQNQRT